MEARPQTNEYAPIFGMYVNAVPEGNIVHILRSNLDELVSLLEPLNEKQAEFRYAEGKWSIKEVLGHITDNERVWTYRLLRIARGDNLTFPGYEQEQFVREAQFDRISLRDLLDEFIYTRRSAALLLQGLPEEVWLKEGQLYHNKLTARAAACVIAGHEIHHRNILKERYLSQLSV
ncbi:DinB family protein [Paenibacillus hamazuiensis]|uniref:DinB family protein n=1 Tax=Paenibacillus hamazuiensis TaxID=2936508 RepID=UPI00200E8893|nr:DinB family protein [Paenibacillus hamazuiensis]